jgi:hypothetical protein
MIAIIRRVPAPMYQHRRGTLRRDVTPIMTTRNRLLALGAAATLGIAIGTYAFTASSQEGPRFGPPMRMGPGMMSPGMMGLDRDATATADVSAIHELVVNHDRIKRTVTNLPDGIRTVTESDDPRIAKLIQEHVAGMGKRVRAGKMLGLPIESPAVHAIYANKDKIRTTSEPTEKGVVVVQTSSDPKVVALLQEHAVEVTNLVEGGMAAMHTAMMRNHGGMMRGPMMRGMPRGGMTDDDD